VLAAFDLLSISFSLYLNHQLMAIYTESVRVDQEWANRQNRYSDLAQLAGAVNAPGNDVFHSQDVEGESERLVTTLAAFDQAFAEVRDELAQMAPNESAQLLGDLAQARRAMDEMVGEAEGLLDYFRNQQRDQAGERMASMDRKYADLSGAFARLNRNVREIQKAHFTAQETAALSQRSYEILIAGCIAIMVLGVTLYGSRLTTAMLASNKERERYLAVLREREEQLRLFAQVFEFSREAILITGADTRILSVNRAFIEITGYSIEDIRGEKPDVLASGLQAPEFYRNMWRTLTDAGRWQGEIWNRRKNSEIYPEWLSISDVRDENGKITHYVGIFSDITEYRAAQEKIEYLARHDPLTNLPNRNQLDDCFARAVAHVVRAGGKLGLLFLDLDRFKAINDTLGHAIGDKLLQDISKRLLNCVREIDTVCRQGGDEFIILLDDVASADAVASVARKILDILGKPFEIENHNLVTSFSIGIAIYPDDGRDITTLMKKADTAMYHAKESGRNTYRFHTEQMNLAASMRMMLESALRRALERHELQLYYQPQIDLADGQLLGVEALLRWNSSELGWVSPGEFIPVAEDSGLIVPIGQWVLREACRQAVVWREQGMSSFSVSVNLSALQFKRGYVDELVETALRETGLEPARLELELTESILLHDVGDVMETLQRIKGMGVRLSIDDFGTGYSSLSYLRRLAVDQLKIDQSFVRDLPDNTEGAALVRAIIQMARALSLATLAEGVETEEQLRYLRAEGCGAAQGFYLARPMPPADFVQRYFPGGAMPLS
jgi:diguanylate cyclase (GGDEF)-like protein/PAS domain S-box-containing protein